MTREQVTEPFRAEINGLTGKVVRRAYQRSGAFHPLDEGYALDGGVVVEFEDGTTLTVSSHWCNDDTSSTEYEIERPQRYLVVRNPQVGEKGIVLIAKIGPYPEGEDGAEVRAIIVADADKLHAAGRLEGWRHGRGDA